ncbi:MAG: SDR family NAD(P)-dependent oxidoreductase [Verrucomicrobiota bacterium]
MNSFSQRFPAAFVTGASSGLGLVIAKSLQAEGVEVWAGSRSAKRIVDTGLPFRPVELDLADGEAVRQFIQAPPWTDWPTLLVNNAGYGEFSSIKGVTGESLSKQVTAMLTSAADLARAFLSAGVHHELGTGVVNVSSLAVEFPLPFLHGYNAVKAGLSGFSRSLAIEFPGGGNRAFVLDLRPGDYRTGFNEAIHRKESSDDLAQVWAALEKHLQQGADPEAIWPPLRSALLAGNSGTVRVGTFFQAKFAPFMAKILPERWMSFFQKRYYNIR